MRFLFALVLFVTLCAADDGLPVIDLYPLVKGLDGVPPSAGDLGIWLYARTFTIDLEEVPIEDDHLWEASVFADKPIWHVHPCEWQIGYVVDGNMEVVRSGGFGPDGIYTDYDMYITSSAVVWLRGNEISDNATHVFIDVRACYLGRYLTRWVFEEWNGDAYLMDWSGDDWIANGWEDYTVRMEYDLLTDEDDYPIRRDSSIPDTTVGWWTSDFFFDWSDFADLARPVLELWVYAARDYDQEIGFYFCNAYLEDCEEYEDYDYSNSGVFVDSNTDVAGFVRIFFDIKKSQYTGNNTFPYVGNSTPYLDDGSYTLDIYLEENYTVVAPYAKIWNFRNDTENSTVPFLLDASSEHAGFYSDDCYWYTTANEYTLDYTGPGLYQWSCSSTYAGSEVSFTLPESIEAVTNPWFMWNEYVQEYDYVNSWSITVDNELIYEYTQAAMYDYELYGWDRQMSLGHWKHYEGERVTIKGQGYEMAFLSVMPLFEGALDNCAAAGDPCQNGGECHNWYYGYTCICPLGWEDENCTTSTDDCHMNSCLNGGECVDELNYYWCNCTDEWVGDRCEIFVNNCPQDFCLNGGSCVTGADGTFSCDCEDTGFSGDWCEHNDDNCALDPFACQNGGQCVSGEGWSYTCECTDDWTGQWCEESRLCVPNPCHNDGVCILNDNGDAAECLCTGEYFGDWCEYDIEEYIGTCGGLVCYNGGVCLSFDDGTYGCDCRDVSWTGQFCDEPVVCTDDNNPCQHDAACVRGNDGTAKCVCVDGYTGQFCEEDWAAAVMETFAVMAEDCRFGVGCMNDGECTEQTDGTYACECGDDHYGDWCEWEVACSPNPCQNDGYCVKGTDGLPKCLCASGYTGDWCEDEFTSVLDDNFAVLLTDCRYGTSCENDGECVEKPDGSFACSCPDDYYGDDCSIPTACTPNPCGDYGMCDYQDGEVLCFCSSNRFGPNCEYTLEDFFVPDCRFSGCENGGTCLHQVNSKVDQYVCKCPSDWVGETCETHSSCDPNPCNTGECVYNDGNTICVCSGDYYGEYCEHNNLAAKLDEFESLLQEFIDEVSSSSILAFPLVLLITLSLRFF